MAALAGRDVAPLPVALPMHSAWHPRAGVHALAMAPAQPRGVRLPRLVARDRQAAGVARSLRAAPSLRGLAVPLCSSTCYGFESRK